MMAEIKQMLDKSWKRLAVASACTSIATVALFTKFATFDQWFMATATFMLGFITSDTIDKVTKTLKK